MSQIQHPTQLVVFGGRGFGYKKEGTFVIHNPEHQALMEGTIQKLVNDGYAVNPTLLCGMARGADLMAYGLWKAENQPVREFPAEWSRYGRQAGFLRNSEMAQLCDKGLCFWDGVSKGTAHMIREMEKLNKPLIICRY